MLAFKKQVCYKFMHEMRFTPIKTYAKSKFNFVWTI